MRKNKLITTIATASMIAALALTGCGSGNSASVEGTESTLSEIEAENTESADVALLEGEDLEETIETDTEEIESTQTEETETEVVAESDSTDYTYTDLSATMYADSSVSVRDLPSTDGNKLGSLSANQEVTVTGQCNETSWYRIEYKNGVGYVSNKYLSEEKVATTSTGSGSGSASDSAGSSASAGTSDASVAASTGSTASADTSNGLLDKSIGQAILAKINAERSAAGTAQMTWDETLYSYACQRAQAIVSNFSHAGATYAENIAFSGKTSPTADNIHTQFYNSSAHRDAYMNSKRTNCAVAVYYCNGVWYAVEAFSGDGYSYSCDSNGNWSVSQSTSTETHTVTAEDMASDPNTVQNTTPSSNSWTASNGVTVYDMGNGILAAGGGYTGTQEEWDAAVAEYYATH
jgi:uncharacterized protein YkwD